MRRMERIPNSCFIKRDSCVLENNFYSNYLLSGIQPFWGILGKVGKTKEAVKNCPEMVRVTAANGLKPEFFAV